MLYDHSSDGVIIVIEGNSKHVFEVPFENPLEKDYPQTDRDRLTE